MKEYPIVAIIGCGRMGSLLTEKLSQNYQVLVYDHNEENAKRVSERTKAIPIAQENLSKADLIIFALATETIPEAIKELEQFFNPKAILVNIATTLPRNETKAKQEIVAAKIVGHAKEIALGERPVIIIEGESEFAENIVAQVFKNIGDVLIGNSELVSYINTIASREGILTALKIKNTLKELDLPEEVTIAAIRLVAAGTMKAFALGDAGPFVQKIIQECEKDIKPNE